MATDVLARALEAVTALSARERIEPGVLRKVAFKRQWTVVIGTAGQAGMAMNVAGSSDQGASGPASDLVAEVRALVGQPLTRVVERLAVSGDTSRRAVALAALNALSQPLLAPERLKRAGFGYTEDDLPGLVRRDDEVAIIGYGGLVRQFIGRCRVLHVTELKPAEVFRTLVVGETLETGPQVVRVHPASENREVLGRCDVVFVTGSTLVNGTFDEVVSYAAPARTRVVYGPSAQLPVEFFFANGIDHVRAATIRDVERFEFDAINEVEMEAALRSNSVMWEVTPGSSEA